MKVIPIHFGGSTRRDLSPREAEAVVRSRRTAALLRSGETDEVDLSVFASGAVRPRGARPTGGEAA